MSIEAATFIPVTHHDRALTPGPGSQATTKYYHVILHWNARSSRRLGQMAGSPLTKARVCPGITVKDMSCRVSRLQGAVRMVSRPPILPVPPSITRATSGPSPSPALALFPGSGG